MSENRVRNLFDRLRSAYGPQGWWPADDPLEMIVGAILTQRTAWRNAALALRSLQERGLLSVAALADAPDDRISEAIRPAGFRVAKTRTLKGFARHVSDRYKGDFHLLLVSPTGQLRKELLGLWGIGDETADAILLYAARKPSFVIDAYARRLLDRLGWIAEKVTYEALRSFFLDALPDDVDLLGEYHALIVRHGKKHCRAIPKCSGCPLRSNCAAGKQGEDE